MASKISRYLAISSAILMLIASIMYFLMLGIISLMILAAMTSPTFNYYPGVIPYLIAGAGIFLFIGFILMLWRRANPAEHRISFFAIGIISLIIGVLYFLIPIGPFGPPPFINRNAPGPIIMFSLPIIAGIITIIAPLLKGQT